MHHNTLVIKDFLPDNNRRHRAEGLAQQRLVELEAARWQASQAQSAAAEAQTQLSAERALRSGWERAARRAGVSRPALLPAAPEQPRFGP